MESSLHTGHSGELTLQAVILAGTRESHSPLLAESNVSSKTLLPVGGKPMVASVLEAIAGCRYHPPISISSNDPAVLSVQTRIPFHTMPSEANAVNSMLGALNRLPDTDWVLFISGDHPLLTSKMIDYFIEEVLHRDLTFGVAVVARSLVQRDYPQSRRTYFEAKGEGYSGANMFLINKNKFQGNTSFMKTIDRNRKKPWKSAFMLDPLTLAQILLRQLDIHEVIRRASRVFECEAGVVEMPFAECCMDVDKPSDYELAEIILRNRHATQGLPR